MIRRLCSAWSVSLAAAVFPSPPLPSQVWLASHFAGAASSERVSTTGETSPHITQPYPFASPCPYRLSNTLPLSRARRVRLPAPPPPPPAHFHPLLSTPKQSASTPLTTAACPPSHRTFLHTTNHTLHLRAALRHFAPLAGH